ncbi:MAG: amidohydrolase [Ruminiclostridium sp.]|jgi:predicted amidohydrolase YtcJ|nr:amidohydrolase [Ruminiclostridium sp.]
MQKADTIFTGGTILTMDPSYPRAQAVAVRGEHIIAVGERAEVEALAGPGTKLVHIDGKTMIPGFHDAHSHLLQYGLELATVDLTPEVCPSIQVMKRLIAQRAAQVKPGEWVRGWGWDESRMEEGRMPTADDLSQAAPNNPVMITRTCYHMVVANRMALELGGVTNNTPNPQGGCIVRDAQGVATGLLQDDAQNFVKAVIPPPEKAELKTALALASKVYNSCGITSTCDGSTLLEIRGEIPAWCESSQDGTLLVRTTALMSPNISDQIRAMGMTSNFGNDMFRFGCVKFFMDGSLGGMTACMTKPYLIPPYGKGLVYMEQEELNEKIKSAHDTGYQISVHGIGDHTLDMILTAFEQAQAANPRRNHRHRIEHASMSYPPLLKRMKKLELDINMNPAFLYFLGKAHVAAIADEVAHEFPLRSCFEMGIPVSIGSDCPVEHCHPKYGIYAATSRRTIAGQDCGRKECITMAQALYAFTMAGAHHSFEEHKKGSIIPGKLADFAVLDRNPLETQPEEILDMKVLMTVLGGQVVYEA